MAKQNLNTSISLKPRKKAKTAEEKEQRRIERIMRNRRAAHKSRERKRFYLNLYQQKSEKYDLLFDMLIKHNVLNSNKELNSNESFLTLKNDICQLNSDQKLFEKENGTVNSSIPKKDEDDSDFEETILKKRKFSHDDFSSTSESVTETIHSPGSSTFTLKDVKPEDQDLDYLFKKKNLNFTSNLDLDLELGICLDENIPDLHNLNYPLFPNENESFIMQQRYPAEITSK